MFEVPSAKRVKRSQIFASDDEEADSMIDTDTRPHSHDMKRNDSHESFNVLPNYGFEYDFISAELTTTPAKSKPHRTADTNAQDPNLSDGETYQFNLFAPTQPSKPTTAQSQAPAQDSHPAKPDTTTIPTHPLKISLRSPSPDPESKNPSFVNTQRPASHYFTSALPQKILEARHSSYSTSAIDPSTLLRLSKSFWPGTSHPWRLTTLPAHKKQVVVHKVPNAISTSLSTSTDPKPTPPPTTTVSKTRRRPRPSKKRRDQTKSKAQRRQIIIDETKTKEEHEREKRNRKNRERKVKRRAKERREKGGGTTGDGSDVEVVAGGEGEAEAGEGADTSY